MRGVIKINGQVVGEILGVGPALNFDPSQIVELEPRNYDLPWHFCSCCGTEPTETCAFKDEDNEDNDV